MSIAVFAGTFDPFTLGHLDIVRRACPRFEKLYVAVTPNPDKGAAMFSLNDRMSMIREAVKDYPNVEVTAVSGLLVDHCHEIGADTLIRSIRSASDIDYERQLETVNNMVDPNVETMYLLSNAELAYISSTLVRSLIKIGISIEKMVPDPDHPSIRDKIEYYKLTIKDLPIQ